MNENILMLIDELLRKIEQVSTMQELDRIIDEYDNKLNDGSSEALRIVLDDIKSIGERLISLHNVKSKAKLSSLTEQEKTELAEVEKIIKENLFNYHFQPIVNTVDGEIYSYEALMRPKSELCPSPYHVMKYSELSDRLDDIERATFLNILGIIDRQKEEFSGRKVFINSILKTKLTDEDYRRINRLLEKHSDTVVVEMTEQAELGEEEFGKIKERYNRMNVKIAIDDYGTGYSNVQNLLRYMPDYVKIDRSLLTDIQNNSQKRHFVREIIEFCHDNNILALAEGVETAEELRTVILLGADLIQGYYTSRPAAEIAESIPFEIKQEIKLYKQEREEGKKLHIYTAGKTERVLLDRLAKEDYRSILVGKNGNGDITVAAPPGFDTKIRIDVADGYKGNIVIDNVELSATKNRPCIDIGENCEVRLIVTGVNNLKKGGIRVPESSKLTIAGEGRLSITVDSNGSYGIGNDIDSRHGNLIFEHGVSIENHSPQTGVCIGSGLGGKIKITRGQFTLNMNGITGVAIGAVHADTDLDLFACDFTADVSFIKGAAIGSVNGSAKVHIHSSSVKLYLSGKNVVGIGTISGEKCDAAISEANAVINVLGDNCSAIASIEGDTTFKLSRAGMHLTAAGTDALAIGGYCGDTRADFMDSDSSVRLTTAEIHEDFVRNQQIVVLNGRARFVLNKEDMEYKQM